MKNFSIALSVTACVAALLFSGCRTTLPPNRPTQAEFYTAAEDLVRQAEKSERLQSFINSYYEKNKGDKERGFYPLVMWAPTQFNLRTLHGAHRIHIEPLMIRFQEIAINKGWFTFSAVLGEDRLSEISALKDLIDDPEFKESFLVKDGKYLPASGVMRLTLKDSGYTRETITWTVTLESVGADGLTWWIGTHTIERTKED